MGTRGLMIDNNAKTNVMLDGQSINQRVHFGTMISLDSPLIGNLSRIELSLSPGTIIHGSGAINGFLNLVPKNGTDNNETFAKFEHGFKDDLYSLELGHGFAYGVNELVGRRANQRRSEARLRRGKEEILSPPHTTGNL